MPYSIPRYPTPCPPQNQPRRRTTRASAADEQLWRQSARAMRFTTENSSSRCRRRACIAGLRGGASAAPRENVRFFLTNDQAEQAGYRACLRCRPRSGSGNAQSDGVKAICRFIEQHLDEPVTLARLGREFHQSAFHLQRRFQGAARHHPARSTPTPAACARSNATCRPEIRSPAPCTTRAMGRAAACTRRLRRSSA